MAAAEGNTNPNTNNKNDDLNTDNKHANPVTVIVTISFIHVDVAQYFWLASILINIIIGQRYKIKNLKSLII